MLDICLCLATDDITRSDETTLMFCLLYLFLGKHRVKEGLRREAQPQRKINCHTLLFNRNQSV
jgi:hypothetical protein